MDKKFKNIIKIQLIIFTLILFVGYAGSTSELIQNSETKIAFDKNDFNVYFTNSKGDWNIMAFPDSTTKTKLYTMSISELKKDQEIEISFDIKNDSTQYDAYVYLQPTGGLNNYNISDYYKYEQESFTKDKPELIKAKNFAHGTIKIKVIETPPVDKDNKQIMFDDTFKIVVDGIERTDTAIPMNYKVIFDPQGGTISERERYVLDGEPLGELPTATKYPYENKGWYDDDNNLYTADTKIIKDVTLHPKWTTDKYIIHYDANGGIGTMEDSILPRDGTGKLRKNTFTKKDYIFDGWTQDGLSVQNYKDEDYYKDNSLFTMNDAEKTLHAKWRKEVMDTYISFTPSNPTLKQLGYTVEETNRTTKTKTNDKAKIYEIKKDGKLVTSINIPEYYTYGNQKYRITSIGGRYDLDVSDYPNDTIEEIIMPNSIDSLELDALAYYSKLSKVHFPNNIKIIGSSAFEGCTSLTNITLPETVEKVGNSAFSNCSSLTSITLPAKLKEIGIGAFSNTKLNSIVIPGSVTTIGSCAFQYTNNLKTVVINEGVKEINSYAFNDSALTKVVIPSTVTSIGIYAFGNNKNLAQVYIKSTNVTFGKSCFVYLKPGTTSAYGSTIYVKNSKIRDTLLSNKHDGIMCKETDYITLSNNGVMTSDTYVTQVSTNYNWNA